VEREAPATKDLEGMTGVHATLAAEEAVFGDDVAAKAVLFAVLSDLMCWDREVHVRPLGRGIRGDAQSSAGLARWDIWDCSVADQDREAVDSSTSGPSRRRRLADNKSQHKHRCKDVTA